MRKKKEEELEKENVREEKEEEKDSMDEVKGELDSMVKEADIKFMEQYEDVTMDDLIMKGYVEHTAEIAPGFTVKVRTLRKREELDIKRRVSDYEGIQLYIMDQANTNTMTYALMELNGTELPELEADSDDFDESFHKKRSIILDLSDAVVVAIREEFKNLTKALVILLKGSSKNYLARHLLGQE